MQPLYAILGPTASGKTDLGIALAKAVNGVVISADSRQIYLGLDIGTAKVQARKKSEFPDPQAMIPLWQVPILVEGVEHFLVDIYPATESYSAFDFQEQAAYLIKKIRQAGKTPIVVGGTGLYVDALLFDFKAGGASSSNQEIRDQLTERYKKGEGEQMWQELNEYDPETADKIHPNNPQHLIRALEYYKVTGQPKSKAVTRSIDPVYPTVFVGLEWERAKLYERIKLRIDRQLDAGLVSEVEQLLRHYKSTDPGLSSIGYKEIGQYLANELSLEQAVEIFKKNTCQYAKRQLTWLRRNSFIKWYDGQQSVQNPQSIVEQILADQKFK